MMEWLVSDDDDLDDLDEDQDDSESDDESEDAGGEGGGVLVHDDTGATYGFCPTYVKVMMAVQFVIVTGLSVAAYLYYN